MAALQHKLDLAKRAYEANCKSDLLTGKWRENILLGGHIQIEELEFRIKHLANSDIFDLTLSDCQELGLTEATPWIADVRAA